MKKQLLNAVLVIAFVSIGVPALSAIRLPSVISSNMVLQQQSVVKLWGWADPGEGVYITASWSGKTDSVWASSGATWELLIKTPAAGGPYTISFKGKNEITLDNILIGEVWVCSGQSNMEMSSVSGVDGMDADLPVSTNSQIRFFHIPKVTSQYPQDNCGGVWQSCDPVSLKTFSAVGYYFGKKLQDSLHVPIGLINSSWGGTPAETWAPASLIENDTVLKNAAGRIQATKWWPITPGAAYNGMIAPITNFAIAGVIWYQGEGNAVIHATYQQTFTGLIDAWRKAWKKEFPFYYVQIAPYTYGKENISAYLREQQMRTMAFPNTGMVVITDLVEDVKNIHPKNKKDVGFRLANWALGDTYHHSGLVYKSPMYRNMIVNNGKAEIYFDNAPNGFMIKGNKATEWFIAGEDRQFLPAEVTVKKDRLLVFNKAIKNPVAVRFAFSDTAIGNIFSKEGLPVGPFRTDGW